MARIVKIEIDSVRNNKTVVTKVTFSKRCWFWKRREVVREFITVRLRYYLITSDYLTGKRVYGNLKKAIENRILHSVEVPWIKE